jgi:hypothetical protein
MRSVSDVVGPCRKTRARHHEGCGNERGPYVTDAKAGTSSDKTRKTAQACDV